MDFVKNDEYEALVYKEAVFVGATFLPMWWIVKRSTAFFNITPDKKEALDIFLAGAVYHIVAESIGLNEYYTKHGASVKKMLLENIESIEDGRVVSNSDFGLLCAVFPSRDC